MDAVLQFPLAPMEALPVDTIPTGDGWQYEPKWDGFRCLLIHDGDKVELQSKAGKSLTRYFPEIVAAANRLPACVLDGELAISVGRNLSFDALLQRIHPAASRVKRLSLETPAMLIVFDLLRDDDGAPLLEQSLRERRAALEKFAGRVFPNGGLIRLSPATTALPVAKAWLKQAGPALDGIIAKRLDLPYRPGERTAMQKVKNYRTADCVVGGFRFNEGKDVVGSLLLGLYNEEGKLDHVGFTSTIKESEKQALTTKLLALVSPPGFTGEAPGGPSRWSPKRSAEWQPLKPKLVVEVCYDHWSGGRFRHGTRLLRWRPDKSPRQCTREQVEQTAGHLLELLGPAPKQFFQKRATKRAARAGRREST